MMTTETDLAYIAGLLDGEAHIGIKRTMPYKCQGRSNPGYHARIQIQMVDEPAIKFIAETLGGWYYIQKMEHARHRQLFMYQATDAAAAAIIRRVLPYLKVKLAVAETVIELRELQAEGTKHRTKITGYRNFPNSHGTPRQVANKAFSDEYIARCDALYCRCKELNRPGV